jgi:hypothetical protein
MYGSGWRNHCFFVVWYAQRRVAWRFARSRAFLFLPKQIGVRCTSLFRVRDVVVGLR